MGKSPGSYRLGIPIGKIDVEAKSIEIEPVVVIATKSPTPVECAKYGIDLAKAKVMKLSDLTLDDYLFLRNDSNLTQEAIRKLYGYVYINKFYKHLVSIGARVETAGIVGKPELVELGEVIEIAEPVAEVADSEPVLAVVADPVPAPVLSEPIVQSFLPPKLTVITRHICPVCLAEFNELANAEICLTKHVSIENITLIGGHDEIQNCPKCVYARLSDGRAVKYVLFG